MLLKLIYWNKSIQSINIITTNGYQEQPPNNNREIPKKTAMRRKVISKSWYHTLTWMFSGELFGYCRKLHLLFWNFGRKISMGKNLLYGKLPEYLNIYLLESCLLYLGFFHFFQQVWRSFPLKWVINMCLH